MQILYQGAEHNKTQNIEKGFNNILPRIKENSDALTVHHHWISKFTNTVISHIIQTTIAGQI